MSPIGERRQKTYPQDHIPERQAEEEGDNPFCPASLTIVAVSHQGKAKWFWETSGGRKVATTSIAHV